MLEIETEAETHKLFLRRGKRMLNDLDVGKLLLLWLLISNEDGTKRNAEAEVVAAMTVY